MNILSQIFLLLISITFLTSKSWALPPCPTDKNITRGNCFGTNTFANGNKYIGEYKGYARHGQGVVIFGLKTKWAGDKYIGEFKDNQKHGQGTYTYSSGDKFIGKYKDGTRNGKGIYTFLDGDTYQGEWKNSKYHGQGTFIFKNGSKYVGEWKNDHMHGQGTYIYADGTIEEGIWKDDKFLYPQKKPTSPSNSKIEGYKNFCSDIGFTPGTEKFGECVVEAMKKG